LISKPKLCDCLFDIHVDSTLPLGVGEVLGGGKGGIPRVDWQCRLRIAWSRCCDRRTIISLTVSGFSEDGRWWWNGAAWIPTDQVVLPQLPPTEFEKSGRLKVARGRRRESRLLFWALLPSQLGELRITVGARDYRSWTLEQLALATAYLLGPDEPMLAGEVMIYDLVDSWSRGLAVAVTAAHVVVFRIDHVEGQPRSVVLAARLTDVRITARSGVFGYLWPALVVSGWNGRWTIWGYRSAFEPEQLLDAWRKAAKGAVGTG
jgi:hypothetical protein